MIKSVVKRESKGEENWGGERNKGYESREGPRRKNQEIAAVKDVQESTLCKESLS